MGRNLFALLALVCALTLHPSAEPRPSGPVTRFRLTPAERATYSRYGLTPAPMLLATQHTVCATGCTTTPTAANIQTRINAAIGGDEILLSRGITVDGQFTFPAHSGASMVTMRTGVTSTGVLLTSSQLPTPNVRITPALAATYQLATLRALTNNEPVFATKTDIGAGGYWTLSDLALTGNAYGGEALIQLGSDSNTTGEQDAIARIPAHFTLERLYLYGDPVIGQFRGVRIHVNDWTLRDSYIKDIKSTSEGQAVYLNSFSSGGLLSNNYIEGGAEGLLSGGAGGCCHPTITVASATNASTFVLSARTDLHVGQGISVEIGGTGNLFEQWVQVASCGTSVVDADCTSNSITVTPALSTTPSVGADVDWGVVPADVTIEKNNFVKPAAWRNAIIGTPQSVDATSATSGGTLAAGSYSYRVVARQPVAVNGMAASAASVEVSGTVTGSTGKVTVSWASVTNATEYRVYGRSAGGENMYWTVTAPTTTFSDTGSAGTTGTVPTGSGTVWYIKNILEFKNARRYTVNGNVFDGIWSAAQTGYGIVVTPANTGHGNDSATVEDITYTNNIFRNMAGVFQITGRDVSTTTGGQISGRLKRITASNNLAYGIGSQWGASLRTVLISTTGPQAYYPNNTASNGPLDLAFIHNTFIQTSGNALLWFDLFKTTEQPAENFIWRDTIGYKNSFGVTGGNSCAQGTICFSAHTSGTSVYTPNVIADASCSAYPAGTLCPTSTTLEGEFQDFAAEHFALKTASTYHNAASDGTDLGANLTTISALTNIALSGDNTGGTPVVPPSVTTLVLPDGTVGASYAETVTGVCPAGLCTWSAASLPTGLSLVTVNETTATITGTASTAGTYPVQVTLTDTGGRAASQTYSVTIAQLIAPPVDPGTSPVVSTARPDNFNLDEGVLFRRATVEPSAGDETTAAVPVRSGDIWSDPGCSTTAAKILTTTSPAVNWRKLAFWPTQTVTTIATVGVATYAAADIVGGLLLRDPNGGNRSDVTPTAALVVAAIPCAAVGDAVDFDIRNTADAAETITVTAGTGVTLSGTMTIAQNNARRFRLVVTNATSGAEAVTVYSLGTYVW